MISTTISHYRIIEKLSEGGMGEVYLARDTELDHKIAIKFLPSYHTADKEAQISFKREVKATAATNHSSIFTIYELNDFKQTVTSGYPLIRFTNHITWSKFR